MIDLTPYEPSNDHQSWLRSSNAFKASGFTKAEFLRFVVGAVDPKWAEIHRSPMSAAFALRLDHEIVAFAYDLAAGWVSADVYESDEPRAEEYEGEEYDDFILSTPCEELHLDWYGERIY